VINGFIYCENPGKVDGVCCSGLPINQIHKHLTDTAIRETSDAVVHGYKILPSAKAALQREIRDQFPDAPLTPLDMQKIVPLPGQVGPIVRVAPPVEGYICQVCRRGYTTLDSGRDHWKKAHKDLEILPADRFVKVPQMQTLSRHQNFIRYFEIVPGPLRTQCLAPPLAPSDDMTLLDSLQDAVFGPDNGGLVELDSDVILEFFRNSGAEHYVRGLSNTTLIPLVASPQQDEPKLVKLRRAQNLRFKMHSRKVFQGNVALQRLIVTTKP
jgi:hypothetical protein